MARIRKVTRRKPVRPCLGCGELQADTRCPRCRAPLERARQVRRAEAEPWQAWYGTPAFRAARARCLERAGHQCERLELDGKRCLVKRELEAHHVVPARLAPALFFEDDNLLALCRAHHAEAERELRRSEPR